MARNEHYRNLNDELKQKAHRLFQEAREIVESETISIAAPVSTQPSKIPSTIADDVGDAEKSFSDDYNDPETEISPTEDDAILGPVSKLGSRTKERYLIARVRVLEESVEKQKIHLTTSQNEVTQLTAKLHEVENERNRLNRLLSTNTAQLDKLKQSLEETQTRIETLTAEKSSLVKEVETNKRSLEQQSSSQKSISLKLNRALEEVDRQKIEAERIRTSAQESVESSRQKIENLTVENRRLLRQKQELIAGFKKQLRLIDVLRRMKMLTEASRALKITEDEFLKTLDWQSG